nr:hypothetical protein BaRGS_009649 [Batillaria attramentaria]
MGKRINDQDSMERDRDSQGMDTESSAKRDGLNACHGHYTVVTAILVRLLLLAHSGAAVWVVVSLRQQNILVVLLAVNVLMLIETIYTLVKRKGRESKWFCPCFLAYLCAVLPSIWLVELHRLHDFENKFSNITGLQDVQGLTVPFKLESDVWVAIIEQTLLFLLVLCRWFLPRGELTRQELSQLLFVFMGIASDNMELFELFDETDVRSDELLTYIILGVWSLSLLQFTFVLTATRSPRKIRVALAEPEPSQSSSSRRQGRAKKRSLGELIFATEIWALTFSVLVQDGPYAGVRIYALFKYNLITYSIIFFVCKNLLIVCLVFYRLTVLCLIKLSEIDDDDDDDNDNASEVSDDKNGRNRGLLNGKRGQKVEPVPSMRLEDINSSDT